MAKIPRLPWPPRNSAGEKESNETITPERVRRKQREIQRRLAYIEAQLALISRQEMPNGSEQRQRN